MQRSRERLDEVGGEDAASWVEDDEVDVFAVEDGLFRGGHQRGPERSVQAFGIELGGSMYRTKTLGETDGNLA